jgi:7-carboxy-7-deazaguanine synthase
MSYAIKEIFYSLQGEGINSGRAAVFCRFAGCNLWSGSKSERDTAICKFCDTDFIGTDGSGGGRFETANELASATRAMWLPAQNRGRPLLVCTGGEPSLQLDTALVDAFHQVGFEIAIETNGTRLLPERIDHICVSPKAGAPLLQKQGRELKLVYPQPETVPENYESLDFEFFFLQPMDGRDRDRNTALAIKYCQANPKWRLGLQIHKFLGIP